MRFDKSPFTCQREKEDKKATGFQISQFYWSFSSDITAAKGIRHLHLAEHNTYFQRTEREAFSKHKSRTPTSTAYLLQNGYNRGFALLQVVQHHQDVAVRWQTSSRGISNVTHLKPRVAHFWNKQTFDRRNKTQSSTFLTLVALWNKQIFNSCNKVQSSTFLPWVTLRHK